MLIEKYTNKNNVQCFVYDNRFEANSNHIKFEYDNQVETSKAYANPNYKPRFKQAGYKKVND